MTDEESIKNQLNYFCVINIRNAELSLLYLF